jgi:hypothetical protein
VAVEVRAEWYAFEPPDTVYDRITEFVRKRGGRIEQVQPFQAHLGDFWKMRLIGGWLTADADLPIRLDVTVDTAGPPYRVRVVGLDRMGFGIRTGIVAKFRRRLEVVLAELQAEVQSMSVPDQLRELTRLRDSGELTPQQFEDRRTRLVQKL